MPATRRIRSRNPTTSTGGQVTAQTPTWLVGTLIHARDTLRTIFQPATDVAHTTDVFASIVELDKDAIRPHDSIPTITVTKQVSDALRPHDKALCAVSVTTARSASPDSDFYTDCWDAQANPNTNNGNNDPLNAVAETVAGVSADQRIALMAIDFTKIVGVTFVNTTSPAGTVAVCFELTTLIGNTSLVLANSTTWNIFDQGATRPFVESTQTWNLGPTPGSVLGNLTVSTPANTTQTVRPSLSATAGVIAAIGHWWLVRWIGNTASVNANINGRENATTKPTIWFNFSIP